jgi:GNAT superfamily N-acetyltransferase
MPDPMPPEQSAVAQTRDGVEVRLRPQRHDERDLVAGFFAGLSQGSRYRRFLQPVGQLPEGMLRHLLAVDGHRHVAMVATVGGECVGIARYLALSDEPGVAEVAVTVTDRYQRRGIGRLLVEALRAPAVRAGITTFLYLVHPSNRAALGLVRSLGVQPRWSGGLVEGRQRLPSSPSAAA